MKVAIVGSRGFNDYSHLENFIDEACKKNNIEIELIISGGARGADALGEQYARDHHIETKIFPAEWDKYGKSAGFKRNVTIIENCDICFAFWDGQSHGTKHDIQLCSEMKKPCYISLYNDKGKFINENLF